jgi:Leucine-rich repeat (LRR) protein
VPEKINIFADLQLLRMKNNQLLSLPVCLTSLQTFKMLDVSRNKIASLPKEYALFPALVELNLSENCLTLLPDFVRIKSLEVLLINDNRIKELPILGENIKKVEASTNNISRISA